MSITVPTRRALAPSLLALPLLALSACAEPAPEPDDQSNPQELFMTALASHCGPNGEGKAFEGQLVSTDEADADFAGAEMVMHVRECTDDTIKVPFHVKVDGEWDRSRTWVISRTDTGLRLKHDHRHEDGEPDAVTMYGGDTIPGDEGKGWANKQSFPVDDFSIAMFKREGLDASITNVWTVEIDPADSEGAQFAYQLQRTTANGAPEDRFFRVEFDLTKPVDAPPAPWGHESLAE